MDGSGHHSIKLNKTDPKRQHPGFHSKCGIKKGWSHRIREQNNGNQRLRGDGKREPKTDWWVQSQSQKGGVLLHRTCIIIHNIIQNI
jgi:hypothetical protein